jgi:hypothetical protein
MTDARVLGDYYDPAGHRYVMGGRTVPSVTQVLKADGIIDTTFLNNEQALRRGTAVHKLCEWQDETRARLGDIRRQAAGGMGIVDSGEVLSCYARAYTQFLVDHAPRYTHVEVGLLHGTLRFGGRPDRICADLAGQGPAVLELKTGSPAPWHGVQLAAYQLLFPTGARWVCYLKPNGRYDLRRCTNAADYQTFLGALARVRSQQGATV